MDHTSQNTEMSKQALLSNSDSQIWKTLICIFLTAIICAVYWQTLDHQFTNFDDNVYVTDNRHVQAGLSSKSIAWAFASTHASNWHPLTWLSHMLDCQLYGLKPAGHHLTNVLFHIANTLLLFVVLTRMTGALWRSAFVAALFAIHPLNVESVAWIAERKNVLSAFFWLLTMWAYARYTERTTIANYLLALLIICLGSDVKTHAGHPALCSSYARLLAVAAAENEPGEYRGRNK